MLEDSIAFEISNAIINVENIISNSSISQLDLLKQIRKSTISDKINKSNYDLTIDLEKDWEEKLKEYLGKLKLLLP